MIMFERITRETYDEIIKNQDLQFQVDTYYEPKEPAHQRRIDKILSYLEPGPAEKILDVGCGVGTFVFHGAKKGAVCFGVDYSREAIRTAAILSHRYHLEKNMHLVVGNALELPLVSESVEKMTSIDFIEHITDDEKDRLLGEMKRVLKKGGRLIVFTPNKIREDIAHSYWVLRRCLFRDFVPEDKLHYGLITRGKFERLLKKHGLVFKFFYEDVTRPFLARWFLLNRFLSLNLCWVITKP
jgi:ubiquinone/menaquinone biosynthesis C-methylase UbiE